MLTLTCVKCGAQLAAVQLPEMDAKARTLLRTFSSFAGGVDLVALFTDPAQLSASLGAVCPEESVGKWGCGNG